jgi:4'-phosphopantetheinyl transferase
MEVYWLEQAQSDLSPHHSGPFDSGPLKPSVGLSGNWLSANECACLEAMRVPKRRSDWLLGRWTAKHAVAFCLHLPDISAFPLIEIRPAASGAPQVFYNNSPANLTVSLSHSGCTAICAVTMSGGHAVLGCDLETIEPRSDAFISDYFAPDEQALIAQTSPLNRSRIATLLWSAKESALKALRTGLRIDTRSVIVSLTGAESNRPASWQPLSISHDGGTFFYGWWQMTHNYVRTVVAAPSCPPPICICPREAYAHIPEQQMAAE